MTPRQQGRQEQNERVGVGESGWDVVADWGSSLVVGVPMSRVDVRRGRLEESVGSGNFERVQSSGQKDSGTFPSRAPKTHYPQPWPGVVRAHSLTLYAGGLVLK
jgi:hypothetical protein